MRIGFVTNVVPHFQRKFFEGLAARHEVEFFLCGGTETYRDPRHSTEMGKIRGEYLRGYEPLPKLRITPGLVPRILKGRFDLLLSSIDGRFALPATYLLSRWLQLPFVLWTGLWAHPDTRFHRVSFPFLRRIYQQSEAILCYGEHVRRYLRSLGVEAEKTFNAGHAIDNPLFSGPVSEEQKTEARRAMGVPEGRIILFVGRLVPEKGLTYLVEAAARLLQKDVHLVLVGEGEEAGRLQSLAQTLGYGRLHLVRYQTNASLSAFYAAAEVFALPSITMPTFKEPWGVVINEAMNQGAPIVATTAVGSAVGGLVTQGENGFICPERDSEALRSALDRILSDPALRSRMKERSLDRIRGWTFEEMIRGAEEAIAYATARH